MEHKKYIEWINLALYNELGKEELTELEEHLSHCKKCMQEYETRKKFIKFLDEHKLPAVNEMLLEEARRELKDALFIEKNRDTFFIKIKNFFSGLNPFIYKAALGSAVVLLAGFFIGYLTFHTETPSINQTVLSDDAGETEFLSDDTRITNVRFIDQDASDGEIEFIFDAVKPVKMKGNINDEKIKNVLTYSMVNVQNPGVRLNSINAIGKKQMQQDDPEVKEALVTVVKYDENPGVRLEALKLLRKYSYTEKTKNALLYVLMNDENSALRIEAINSLLKAKEEGYNFDKEELSIFKEKMEKDENSFVRLQAKSVVWETNPESEK